MPVNGVSGTTNSQYNVNEVKRTAPTNRVTGSPENNPYSRVNTVNPGNRPGDGYATNRNTINSSNAAPDATATGTITADNRNLGRTIDLIA